mmetsp:Transcript_26829/g.68269  ORF Transcript_26829/g.68269 Transcript_26829/m.68269 type:complete len:208 (-) Transcript_26829:853-1476(-)
MVIPVGLLAFIIKELLPVVLGCPRSPCTAFRAFAGTGCHATVAAIRRLFCEARVRRMLAFEAGHLQATRLPLRTMSMFATMSCASPAIVPAVLAVPSMLVVFAVASPHAWLLAAAAAAAYYDNAEQHTECAAADQHIVAWQYVIRGEHGAEDSIAFVGWWWKRWWRWRKHGKGLSKREHLGAKRVAERDAIATQRVEVGESDFGGPP